MTELEHLERQLTERLCERNGWEYGGDDYDLAVKDVKWFLSQPEIHPLFRQEPGGKLPVEWLCEYLAHFNGNLDYHSLPHYRQETYRRMAEEAIARVRAG